MEYLGGRMDKPTDTPLILRVHLQDFVKTKHF
jgi:hypothetical protein